MAGDAADLGAGARGGADRLFGGGLLYGDADGSMSSAFGGNDILNAKSATDSARMAGDARAFMLGTSVGGKDTLEGSSFGDTMFGDAFTLSDVSRGGNDKLSGYGGADRIYGEAEIMSRTPPLASSSGPATSRSP